MYDFAPGAGRQQDKRNEAPHADSEGHAAGIAYETCTLVALVCARQPIVRQSQKARLCALMVVPMTSHVSDGEATALSISVYTEQLHRRGEHWHLPSCTAT